MEERKPENSYGMAAIHEIFQDAFYPLTKGDILDKYGDKVIEFQKGNPETISNLFRDTPNRIFYSSKDIENTIQEKLK